MTRAQLRKHMHNKMSFTWFSRGPLMQQLFTVAFIDLPHGGLTNNASPVWRILVSLQSDCGSKWQPSQEEQLTQTAFSTDAVRDADCAEKLEGRNSPVQPAVQMSCLFPQRHYRWIYHHHWSLLLRCILTLYSRWTWNICRDWDSWDS